MQRCACTGVGPALPTADLLLAPDEATLEDLLVNGGERTALAEFGTIQACPLLSATDVHPRHWYDAR